jgi:ribosomal-protein-alanine N-acetyltransferase
MLVQPIAPAVGVCIRWMIRNDMPEVLEIENNTFDFPWAEEDFIRALRQRNCIGKVALDGDKIVGYMIYELHRRKLYLANLSVHPTYKRCAVGSQLIDNLISKLSIGRRERIMTEVRETNVTAQLFFRTMGFECVSTFKSHYQPTTEDAYGFRYTYDEGPQSREDERIADAQSRQNKWRALSPQDKIVVLDERLGKGIGATKQRTQIAAVIESQSTKNKKKG